MEIIFLGGFFPKHLTKDILEASKLQVQNSANTFQWAFIKGLNENLAKPIQLITAPFIGWFPKYYKELYLKGEKFSDVNGKYDGVQVGFLNLPLLKNIFKYYSLVSQLKKKINSQNENLIIVYSLDSAYLKAALAIRDKTKNVKVCVIIADLHEFPGEASLFYKLYIKYFEKPTFYKLITKIDAFVVLTDKMVQFLNIQYKPWVRIEGIFETNDTEDNVLNETTSNLKIILYTGALDSQYGIDELLDAFALIEQPNYRLWICGGGPSLNYVNQKVALDNRITYFGIVTKEKARMLQKEATLLINPRSPLAAFNSYSFPSKTMEYLASGTPTLIYKLDGIPDEYYQYCYLIDGFGPESIKSAIIETCEKDNDWLNKMGESAKKFILNSKNSKVQIKKFVNLIETL